MNHFSPDVFSNSHAYKLHAAVGLLERRADALLSAELKIGYSQFLVMVAIGKLNHSSQRGVSDCLGITPAAISRQIEGLCAEGLISRELKSGSRREYQLSLTDTGLGTLNRAKEFLHQRFANLLDKSNPSDIEAFGRIMDEMLSALNYKTELMTEKQ